MGVPNQPAFLPDTAELVAELRGMDLKDLAVLESGNARRVFSRLT
jgi:TatD DNase family protein